MIIINKIKSLANIIRYIYYSIFYVNNYLSLRKKTNLIAIIYSPAYANEIVNIYKELIKQQLDIVLLFGRNYKKDKRFNDNLFCPLIFIKKLSIKVLLSDGGAKRWPGKIETIAMFHGFASLNCGFQPSFIKHYKHIFLRLQYHKTQFSSDELPPEYKNKKIYEIGNPLLDGDIYPINNPHKIKYQSFLYAPTYHVEISSIFTFLEPIINFSQQHHIKLYIKLHQALYRKHDYPASGGVDWKKKIEELTRKNESINFIKNDIQFNELRKIFNKVDLLLTDTSAIAWEYNLITGKPVVFLGEKLKIPLEDLRAKKYEKYHKYPEVYYRYNKLGPTIDKIEDFEQTMLAFSKKFDSYNHSISEFRLHFTYHLGNVSKYAVKEIRNILKGQ